VDGAGASDGTRTVARRGRKVQALPRGGTTSATAGRKVRAGSQAAVQPSQVGIDVARRTTGKVRRNGPKRRPGSGEHAEALARPPLIGRAARPMPFAPSPHQGASSGGDDRGRKQAGWGELGGGKTTL
jgi:hypothetical protein